MTVGTRLNYSIFSQPYSADKDDLIALLHPVWTSAEIADVAHRVNVLDKFIGKPVYDSTLGEKVYATGADPTDPWVRGATLAIEAGAGITGGSGTIYASSVSRDGGIFTTKILLDLTDLSSATSVLDIIGQGSSPAHLGQITAARNGTILTGRMTCLEVPASLTDIDLYSAVEATGVFEDNESTLTATALLTAAGAWSLNEVQALTALPAADSYLYLVNGAADTADVFTAGKFLIELEGYAA